MNRLNDIITRGLALEQAAIMCFDRAENWIQEEHFANRRNDWEEAAKYKLRCLEADECKSEIRKMKATQISHITEESLVANVELMLTVLVERFNRSDLEPMIRSLSKIRSGESLQMVPSSVPVIFDRNPFGRE